MFDEVEAELLILQSLSQKQVEGLTDLLRLEISEHAKNALNYAREVINTRLMAIHALLEQIHELARKDGDAMVVNHEVFHEVNQHLESISTVNGLFVSGEPKAVAGSLQITQKGH
jgi:hypothetical protein